MNLRIIIIVSCLIAVEVSCDFKSSLTFVIDDTYSMENDIKQVKYSANAIFDTVLNTNESQIEDFVLVTFNDPVDTDGLPSGREATQERVITDKREVFKEALSSIVVEGGGYCPEYSMSGIIEGIRKSKVGSTLYVFTDASSEDYDKYEEAKLLAIKKQIQVVFVLTGVCTGSENGPGYLVYKKLATDTGGEIFHLEKNELNKILQYVIENVKGRQTPIANKDFPAGTHSLNFTVDTHAKDVTVSATGNGITSKIFTPDGEKAIIKPIVNLNNININKIPDAIPGEYTVEVSSGSDSHVHVSARTDIIFKHGFCPFKPTTINDTTTTPLPDIKSFISIELISGEVEPKTVQILDINDKILEEVPLVPIKGIKNFYTTMQKDLPTTLFKLAVIGKDPVSGLNIKRIGPPITPQPQPKKEDIINKAPKVAVIVPAELSKKQQLKCKVEGYPQPNIVWVNKDTGKKIPSTSVFSVELPYDFISILNINDVTKNTSFECRADNSLGSDSASVEVKGPYFVILKKPEDITINYQNKGELKCKVDAYPPASITWYKDRRVLLKNDAIDFSNDNSILSIKNMSISDVGNYICEIRNEYKRKVLSAQVSITGAEPPVIDDHIEDITIQSGTDVTISCNMLKGIPKPSITWYYTDNYSGEEKELHKLKDQQRITINNATKESSGTYSCKADNVFGSDYHEVVLTVEYPVMIHDSATEIRVADGKMLTVPCSVEGNPNPKVTWFKDGIQISAGHNIFFYKENIKMIATIKDSGTYKCVAANKFGTVSRSIKVDVYAPASITIPEETKLEVLKGNSLNLPCQAKGHPVPETEWVLHSFDARVAPKLMQKSLGASVLSLSNIQQGQEGFYTCIASNHASTTNFTFEIHVVAAPKIENKYSDNFLKAVEGDVALIIKCNASGVPPPVIRWIRNKYFVTSDSIIEDGSLILKNVSKHDSGVYICDARNNFGIDRKTFNVVVDKAPAPGSPTSTVVIGEGASAFVKCDVPHFRSDQLRWYKNGVVIRSGELTIANAKTSDAGLYTCRVSLTGYTNYKSGNTLVVVGQKPKFTTEETENINIDDGISHYLSCEATGDPEPQIRWWHNNEVIETTDEILYIEAERGVPQGQYVCEVNNQFGSISRYFNISSSDCFIDMKAYTSKLQPLMLSPRIQWLDSVKNGYVFIPQNDYVNLFCPNQFKSFPKRHNWAFCEGGTKFKIQGKTFHYSDIECTEEITHMVESNGETCMNENTELLHVVFSFESDKIEAYNVCFDNFDNKVLYATVRMTSSIADIDHHETDWADKDLFELDLNEAYKCNRQNIISDDGCCFGRRMLVNPKDLFPGVVSQKAAYSYLNVVPHWSTCNTNYNNWDEVEQRVRQLAKATFSELIISTGVAEDQDLSISDQYRKRQEVPKYLWKVVQEEATNSSLVIIQVNMPDLSPEEAVTQVRCRDICNTTEWMKGSNWYDTRRGFVYCCSLKDFENSFGYRGVFPPYHEVLKDVSALPDFSLV